MSFLMRKVKIALIRNEYNLELFFNGFSGYLLPLKNKALQYVFDDYEGVAQPVITSAFWSSGLFLTAAKSWTDVLNNGARVIETELMNFEQALEEIDIDYEFSPEQLHLVKDLFIHKMSEPDKLLVLNESQQSIMLTEGSDGLEQAAQLLQSINIIMPIKK